MQHLWWDLGAQDGGTDVEVKLRGSAANVCLLDAEEYQAYLDGEAFEYFGGFTDESPVELQVPYDDDWYLIIDSYEGRIKAWVSVLD